MTSWVQILIRLNRGIVVGLGGPDGGVFQDRVQGKESTDTSHLPMGKRKTRGTKSRKLSRGGEVGVNRPRRKVPYIAGKYIDGKESDWQKGIKGKKSSRSGMAVCRGVRERYSNMGVPRKTG